MSDRCQKKQISWEDFVKMAADSKRTNSRTEERSQEAHKQQHIELEHVVVPQRTRHVVFRHDGRPGKSKRIRIASNMAQAGLHTVRSIGKMQQDQRDMEDLQRRDQHLERRRQHSAHFLSSQEMNLVEQAIKAGQRKRAPPSDSSKAEAAAQLKAKVRAEREGKHMHKVCAHYFELRACCFYDVTEEIFSVQDVYQGHHQLASLRATRDRYQWLLDMLRLMPENGFHVARRPCCKNCFQAFYGISVNNALIITHTAVLHEQKHNVQ